MLNRFIPPFFDAGSGVKPSDGAKLFFYEPGTSTPKDTYSEPTGTTANANPVISDSNGLFGEIYVVSSYKVVLKDKNDVQIWEADNVTAVTEDTVRSFDTLADAEADTGLKADSFIYVFERATGKGGGAFWRVQSGLTANGFNIVAGQNSLFLSLVLGDEIHLAQLGADSVPYGNYPTGAYVTGTATDCSAAFAHAFTLSQVVVAPKGRITISSDVAFSRFGAVIRGQGDKYSDSVIDITSTASFVPTSDVNELTITNVKLEGVLSTLTNFYETGSVGVDTTSGCNIKLRSAWMSNFEYLAESNYNSFYNSVIDCRLEKFGTGFYKFNSNNLNATLCRVQRFNTFSLVNGLNGATNYYKNTFEIFNGALVSVAGADTPIVNFENNYVELYSDTAIPTNFPDTGTGRFSNNTWFTGGYSKLSLIRNELQLGGCLRVVNATLMTSFESSGNVLHNYSSGNYTDRVFNLPSCNDIYINDVLGVSQGVPVNAGSATLIRSPTPLNDPRDKFFYYDALLAERFYTPSTNKQVTTLSLATGWTNPAAGDGVFGATITEDGIMLTGLISRVSGTETSITTIPTAYRPINEVGTHTFARIVTAATYGEGNQVRLRYLYSTGVILLDGAPASTLNIPFDGLLIPNVYAP